MIETIMKDTGAQSTAEAIARFMEDVQKYNSVYKQVGFCKCIKENRSIQLLPRDAKTTDSICTSSVSIFVF